jgi:hypothetical protein
LQDASDARQEAKQAAAAASDHADEMAGKVTILESDLSEALHAVAVVAGSGSPSQQSSPEGVGSSSSSSTPQTLRSKEYKLNSGRAGGAEERVKELEGFLIRAKEKIKSDKQRIAELDLALETSQEAGGGGYDTNHQSSTHKAALQQLRLENESLKQSEGGLQEKNRQQQAQLDELRRVRAEYSTMKAQHDRVMTERHLMTMAFHNIGREHHAKGPSGQLRKQEITKKSYLSRTREQAGLMASNRSAEGGYSR